MNRDELYDLPVDQFLAERERMASNSQLDMLGYYEDQSVRMFVHNLWTKQYLAEQLEKFSQVLPTARRLIGEV